jgi:DNA-binding FadR family transcriptional regulator
MNPLVIALLLKTGASGDLLELRTMLQTAYCQMAAEKATEEDFSLIEQTASEFEQQSQSAQLNIDLLAQADLNFHYALIQATHNYLIIRLCSTFEELFFISIRDTIANPEGLSWGIVSHRYIIEAIRLNDPEKIKQAVIRSLEKWRGQIESPVEGGAA